MFSAPLALRLSGVTEPLGSCIPITSCSMVKIHTSLSEDAARSLLEGLAAKAGLEELTRHSETHCQAVTDCLTLFGQSGADAHVQIHFYWSEGTSNVAIRCPTKYSDQAQKYLAKLNEIYEERLSDFSSPSRGLLQNSELGVASLRIPPWHSFRQKSIASEGLVATEDNDLAWRLVEDEAFVEGVHEEVLAPIEQAAAEDEGRPSEPTTDKEDFEAALQALSAEVAEQFRDFPDTAALITNYLADLTLESGAISRAEQSSGDAM